MLVAMPVTKPLITLRTQPKQADVAAVRTITADTGYFSADEVEVAVELIEDRLTKGDGSEYEFIFADLDGTTVGYASFGEIACTDGSYDLYWIAVHPNQQSAGIGRRLLDKTERLVKAAGGRRIYVETSSRDQYQPTRDFYLRCAYRVDADQADFYAPGDGKVTLVKSVNG